MVQLVLMSTLFSLPLFHSACRKSHAGPGLDSEKEALAKEVIVSNKCGFCHSLQARGLRLTGAVGSSLTEQARRYRSPEWLRRQITDPTSIPDHEVTAGFEGRQKWMPRFDRLSEKELVSLVEFLRILE